MKLVRNILLSSCCNYRVSLFPAGWGEKSMYFCGKCNTECNPINKSIKVFEKISKGHYRPIDNSEYGYL